MISVTNCQTQTMSNTQTQTTDQGVLGILMKQEETRCSKSAHWPTQKLYFHEQSVMCASSFNELNDLVPLAKTYWACCLVYSTSSSHHSVCSHAMRVQNYQCNSKLRCWWFCAFCSRSRSPVIRISFLVPSTGFIWWSVKVNKQCTHAHMHCVHQHKRIHLCTGHLCCCWKDATQITTKFAKALTVLGSMTSCVLKNGFLMCCESVQ